MLSLRGFSAYYLSVSQVDSSESQAYLNESIISLRNAWYRVSSADKVPIAYILGKAYYQRGFYYADLSMKYLDYANAAGATYPDLGEFRGLAASLLGNYEVAIAAFTEALSEDPSDLLLYTLATSYLKNGDAAKAKQYFSETMRTTDDELLVLKCKGEIARMFLADGAIDDAEREFTAILEKDANSADAHYGLGVVYENRGDLVKARASWRKAVRISPVHADARQKLGI
jgi:tetratricopeptide (TPR) repeat protein